MNTSHSIDLDRISHLQQQEALFEQAKPQLLGQYLGEFIAFESNEVLDHDRDEKKLAERVYTKYGYRDILIKQVLPQEPQRFVRGFVPR
ncbi:hypothetical protein [Phormidesmis priestleyi]